tara:strand:- start:1258 stop:1869 length:612 start_codon:yes stop_codon:yes gene_type:complete
MAYQMCYGKYVANDPCSPFCSKPDGSGCDYSPLANPSGANPFGKTGDPYSVTYSDQGSITGNFTQRTYVPTIDPYQVQTPPKNFHGFASNREEFMTFADYSSEPCAFANQSGSAESITQDGNTTTLTAVPRFSTRNFFQGGEMNGLSTSTPANGGGGRALPHCSCGDGSTCRATPFSGAGRKCCCCPENASSPKCQSDEMNRR